jgi:hypothetical protein
MTTPDVAPALPPALQPALQFGQLIHNVYFTLQDASPATCEQLLAAIHKHLAPHPGVVSFGCGTRAIELNRDVNDRDFDVSLHLVFVDRPAHDAYQTSAAHRRFIDENRWNWKRVRVFDSIGRHDNPPGS